jgi:hypothetical protein
MPTVYIWYPDKDHPYGHAALQTAKYHISFWPDGDTSELGKTRAVLKGVPGSLHFHHELDRYCEGNRLPTGIYKILYATDEAINRIYEEFLQYNGIDPADVTLEAGEKLVRQNKRPEVSVSLTKYAFVPDQAIDYSLKFYTHENNCVSTCCNMILTANPKSFLNKILLGMFDVVTLQIFDVFTVTWFERHIKKHWVKDKWWHLLNVYDNKTGTRSAARYWTWDRWTSSKSKTTGQVEGFRSYPVRFHSKAFNEKKENKN